MKVTVKASIICPILCSISLKRRREEICEISDCVIVEEKAYREMVREKSMLVEKRSIQRNTHDSWEKREARESRPEEKILKLSASDEERMRKLKKKLEEMKAQLFLSA